MLEFMHTFNTVVIFCLIVLSIIILGFFFIIEAYDRLTGADERRQLEKAELARLRLLEEDDEDL